MGTSVAGGLARLMHFETPFKIVRDPGIKGSVATLEDIKEPFFAGLGPFLGGLRLLLKPG
jgi:hypothetical protein